MTSQIPSLIFILLILTLVAGCVQNTPIPSPIPTAADTPVPTQTEGTGEPTYQDTSSPSPQTTTPVTPELTVITPTLLPVPEPSAPAVQQTPRQDPSVAFRDRTLFALENLQEAKNGILLLYKSGDIARMKEKADDYIVLIRKNGVITDMPKKMDYVRLNYYEYTDQAGQFAQSFSDGSTRWMANDKSSANSLFDAGVMASDRADIAEKRIQTFLKDHVQQVQINQT